MYVARASWPCVQGEVQSAAAGAFLGSPLEGDVTQGDARHFNRLLIRHFPCVPRYTTDTSKSLLAIQCSASEHVGESIRPKAKAAFVS